MSIEQTSFIFRYKIFVEDMCSGFFTIHWLLLASSWWALSIHPLSFDTRYLFSQFLGYNGCPAESLSFIPLSFILYHLIQDIHFPQISGYHRCPVESLSFIPLSFLLYSLIQDIFIKIPWVSSVSSWVFILYPGIWLVLAPLLAASSSFSSTSITSSHLLSSSSSNKGKYKYNQLHTLAFARFNHLVKINQFSWSK